MQRRVLEGEVAARDQPEDQQEDQGRHQRELDERGARLVADGWPGGCVRTGVVIR